MAPHPALHRPGDNDWHLRRRTTPQLYYIDVHQTWTSGRQSRLWALVHR